MLPHYLVKVENRPPSDELWSNIKGVDFLEHHVHRAHLRWETVYRYALLECYQAAAAWRYWWLNYPFCCTLRSRMSLDAFQWAKKIKQNWPFHLVDLGPTSKTWLFGPMWDNIQNGISIGSAVFAGFMIVTDRQTYTDHATQSVTSGGI